MLILSTIQQIRDFRQQYDTGIVGLVTTMGYLHEGHISLIKEAKKTCDIVIVSIFVNPLQFGANEDLSRYPRNMEGDAALCKEAGADAIFAPSVEEIYGASYPPQTKVTIANLDKYLCGAKRVGHFDGVCTIVSKLFNIVLPHKSFWGRKDIQQLRIIDTMVKDLNFPVEVIACDTKRAKDGLALSSRNSYLSATEREEALIVPQLLQFVVDQINNGQKNVNVLIQSGIDYLQQHPKVKLDYLEIVDYTCLQPVDKIQGEVVIATAIFVGKTRLIDNIIYHSSK